MNKSIKETKNSIVILNRVNTHSDDLCDQIDILLLERICHTFSLDCSCNQCPFYGGIRNDPETN